MQIPTNYCVCGAPNILDRLAATSRNGGEKTEKSSGNLNNLLHVFVMVVLKLHNVFSSFLHIWPFQLLNISGETGSQFTQERRQRSSWQR